MHLIQYTYTNLVYVKQVDNMSFTDLIDPGLDYILAHKAQTGFTSFPSQTVSFLPPYSAQTLVPCCRGSFDRNMKGNGWNFFSLVASPQAQSAAASTVYFEMPSVAWLPLTIQ